MKKIALKELFPVFTSKIINSFPYVVAQLIFHSMTLDLLFEAFFYIIINFGPVEP